MEKHKVIPLVDAELYSNTLHWPYAASYNIAHQIMIHTNFYCNSPSFLVLTEGILLIHRRQGP